MFVYLLVGLCKNNLMDLYEKYPTGASTQILIKFRRFKELNNPNTLRRRICLFFWLISKLRHTFLGSNSGPAAAPGVRVVETVMSEKMFSPIDFNTSAYRKQPVRPQEEPVQARTTMSGELPLMFMTFSSSFFIKYKLLSPLGVRSLRWNNFMQIFFVHQSPCARNAHKVKAVTCNITCGMLQTGRKSIGDGSTCAEKSGKLNVIWCAGSQKTLTGFQCEQISSKWTFWSISDLQ